MLFKAPAAAQNNKSVMSEGLLSSPDAKKIRAINAAPRCRDPPSHPFKRSAANEEEKEQEIMWYGLDCLC